MDWRRTNINQILLSQERMKNKSLGLALQVQDIVRYKVIPVVTAILVDVASHKMLQVLVRQVALGGKEINLAVPSQDVSQELAEDKAMDVSQEVSPLDVVNLNIDPVASLLVREGMDLNNVVNLRTVEVSRGWAHVIHHAVGLEQLHLLVMINMEPGPVDTLQAVIKRDIVPVNFPSVASMGLVQRSHHAVNNMEQIQGSLQAFNNMDMDQVSLAVDNMVLTQVKPQVVVNMGLTWGSHLVWGNMSPVVLSLLALGIMGHQVQVSHLVLGIMGLDLVNLQLLSSMGLVMVSHLALGIMDPVLVSHQVLDSISLVQLSHLALGIMGQVLVRKLALGIMGIQAQVSHLALQSMRLGQVSHQRMRNMGLV